MSYKRVFVDGHSVIHSWPELAKLHRGTPDRARGRLVALVTRFQDSTHVPVTLVFDGGRRSKASLEPSPERALEVLYSAPGETADAVIERRVAQLPDAAGTVVVTNDRVERITVEGLGAESMSAESFADWVERETIQLDHRLEDLHRKAHKYRNLR